jgi:RHS repeat-associated protein
MDGKKFQSVMINKRSYNHLGNVNAVITDRRFWNATTFKHEAGVEAKNDYYPFGMAMPTRQSPLDYRYGYNGMEVDNEVSGNGNSYTTEFRQYDPRLGRWKSLDPLMAQFPWQSPYCAFDNNPVFYNDPLGLAAEGGDEDSPRKSKKERTYRNPEKAAERYRKKNGGEHKITEKGTHYIERGEGNGVSAKVFRQKESPKAILLGGGDLYGTGEMGINDNIANVLDHYLQKNDVYAQKGDIHVFDSPMWAKTDAHKEIINPIADQIEAMSKKGGPVILYGYSFGGHLLSWVLEELDRRNVTVDVLITVDQASGPGTSLEDRTLPKNVKCNINFYQNNFNKINSHGGENTGINRVVNVNLTEAKNSKNQAINHGNIDNYTELFVAYHIYQYFKGNGQLGGLSKNKILRQLKQFDSLQHK